MFGDGERYRRLECVWDYGYYATFGKGRKKLFPTEKRLQFYGWDSLEHWLNCTLFGFHVNVKWTHVSIRYVCASSATHLIQWDGDSIFTKIQIKQPKIQYSTCYWRLFFRFLLFTTFLSVCSMFMGSAIDTNAELLAMISKSLVYASSNGHLTITNFLIFGIVKKIKTHGWEPKFNDGHTHALGTVVWNERKMRRVDCTTTTCEQMGAIFNAFSRELPAIRNFTSKSSTI